MRLQNFTAFADASFEFSSGVNAIIGANGSGKTHLLKALYAIGRTTYSGEILENLWQLYQTRNIANLIRKHSRKQQAGYSGSYGDVEWKCYLDSASGSGSAILTGFEQLLTPLLESKLTGPMPEGYGPPRPVFIPAVDMMGHSRGFVEATTQIYLDFDLTFTDIAALMTLESKNGDRHAAVVKGLESAISAKVEYDASDKRFYLVGTSGRVAAPLAAEGHRKIATLIRMMQQGWLVPGTALFWDEPEVNLNPVLMDELIAAILILARSGVQVFLATHSYVILKELDLQANNDDQVRFFSLESKRSGTEVNSADRFTDIAPNLILQQYGSLYERDLSLATGRRPRREKVP